MLGVGVFLTAQDILATAGVAIVTPADLGNARYAQWDANSGVATSGGNVTSWTDSVGGMVVSQATGANQPTYSATGFNGAPVVLHSGTSQFLEMTGVGTLPTGSTACEIWALVDNQAVDATVRRLMGYGGTTLQTARTLTRTSGNGPSITTGDGTTTSSAVPAVSLAGRHVLRAQFQATSLLAVDGGGDTPASPALTAQATGTARIRIGSHTLATAAQFFQGGIACILVTQPLTTQQAAGLTAYFKQRGGIA